MSLGVLTRPAWLAAILCALAFPAGAGAVVPGFNGLIAYEDEGDMMVVTPGGRLAKDFYDSDWYYRDPAWSPDGSRLAFTSGGTLWIANADGTGLAGFPGLPATSSYDLNYASPAWSPDGTKLLFVDLDGDLQVVNANGTGLTELLAGSFGSVDWSPSGTKLVVSYYDGTEHQVATLNANGTGLDELALGSDPSWSPDGTKIVFSRSGSIYTMNADGTGEKQIVASGNSPAWSPDGTRIAYQRPEVAVFTVKPDGSGRQVVTNDTEGYGSVDWQPLSVGLQANRTRIDYGKNVVLTLRLAALSSSTSASLKLYQRSGSGAETLVAVRQVGAGGATALSLKPEKNTTYVLRWDGDASHAATASQPVGVKVRAVVGLALYGQYGRSGRYALFHLGTRVGLLGGVAPKHKGSRLEFLIQRQSGSGRWSTVASGSFKLRSNGLVAVVYHPSRTGTYRAKTTFKSHNDHLGGGSPWRFAKVTG